MVSKTCTHIFVNGKNVKFVSATDPLLHCRCHIADPALLLPHYRCRIAVVALPSPHYHRNFIQVVVAAAITRLDHICPHVYDLPNSLGIRCRATSDSALTQGVQDSRLTETNMAKNQFRRCKTGWWRRYMEALLWPSHWTTALQLVVLSHKLNTWCHRLSNIELGDPLLCLISNQQLYEDDCNNIRPITIPSLPTQYLRFLLPSDGIR